MAPRRHSLIAMSHGTGAYAGFQRPASYSDTQGTEPMGESADIRVGTAGWSIPRAAAFRFDPAGTHLQRYSRSLRCAEINSSFHRPHSAATYAKWRHSTPADFRFAVKMPRTITHELKLQSAREP